MLDDEQIVEQYLAKHGHVTEFDWALDQDYHYDKHNDVWYDQEGQYIDLDEMILKVAMDEL